MRPILFVLAASVGSWGPALAQDGVVPWPRDRHGAGPVAEAMCGECHGMVSEIYPRLAGQDRTYLAKQLHDYASGARTNPVMSPIARSIPREERAAVADYFASLAAPTRQAGREDGGELGRRLAAEGDLDRGIPACDSCHAAAGIDRPPASPVLDGLSADYLALQLRLWRTGERNNDPMGRMRGIVSRLTEEEIRATALLYAARGGAQ